MKQFKANQITVLLFITIMSHLSAREVETLYSTDINDYTPIHEPTYIAMSTVPQSPTTAPTQPQTPVKPTTTQTVAPAPTQPPTAAAPSPAGAPVTTVVPTQTAPVSQSGGGQTVSAVPAQNQVPTPTAPTGAVPTQAQAPAGAPIATPSVPPVTTVTPPVPAEKREPTHIVIPPTTVQYTTPPVVITPPSTPTATPATPPTQTQQPLPIVSQPVQTAPPVVQQPRPVIPELVLPAPQVLPSEIPATPVSSLEEEPSEEKISLDELSGIDTSELEEPQGNWLYKRIWWERAEAKYEKLRTAVAQVFETRMKFFNKRAEVERMLDPFFLKVGINQGELQTVINQIEQDRQKQGALPEEKNQEKIAKIEQDKKLLEQTLTAVQLISKLDNDLDAALIKLMEQINRMRGYEQQAWIKFKEIARTLDDKKARAYYYEIDGAWKNVKEIQNYIIGSFNRSFNELAAQVYKQVKVVDDSLQQIKEQGIDLKKSERMPTSPTESPMKDLQEEKEESEESSPGFVHYILYPFYAIGNGVKSFFNALYQGVKWPFSYLFGPQEIEEQSEEPEIIEPSPIKTIQESSNTLKIYQR